MPRLIRERVKSATVANQPTLIAMRIIIVLDLIAASKKYQYDINSQPLPKHMQRAQLLTNTATELVAVFLPGIKRDLTAK